MKGITTSGWVKRVAVILLILLGNPPSLHAADRQIVVVKSSDNAYFNQTIETLINHVDDRAHFIVIDTDTLESARDILQKADIVITLGANSASTVSSQSPNQLIINAYITLEQAEPFQHRNQNHIAVLLNQPLERYLAFSQHLLNLNTLGIIYRSNSDLNQQHQSLTLKLNPYQLGDNNKNLLAKVRQLAKESEALLMLPDQTIYNRDTLKGVLLTTYRARIPVISYSPGHVKSGALAAIYSSPTDIGRHLANLIDQQHRGKLNTKNRVIYAEYYSIATNQRVAYSLGLDLAGEEKLRRLIDGSSK